jgi:hypothetical protein
MKYPKEYLCIFEARFYSVATCYPRVFGFSKRYFELGQLGQLGHGVFIGL